MSVRSIGFNLRGGYQGVYQFPSVRFTSGLEVEQIRDNIVQTPEQLETDLDETNARITTLNDELVALNTDVTTLLNNIILLQNQINQSLTQVNSLQSTINTTNSLIATIEKTTSTPYSVSVLPVNAISPLYNFTPTSQQIYNVPITFFILEGVSQPQDELYNVNINLQFVGSNLANYNNITNGSVAYLYIGNQSQIFYTCQLSTGCLYFSDKVAAAVSQAQFNLAHSDIINVPKNSSQLYFAILISNHFSMDYNANAFTPITFSLKQIVPIISMTKI
jgi:hypothetical protein